MTIVGLDTAEGCERLPMDVIDQVMTRVRFATIGSLDRCLLSSEKGDRVIGRFFPQSSNPNHPTKFPFVYRMVQYRFLAGHFN